MPEREAHPTHVEYVVERALSGGRWVVESIGPSPTTEQALAEAAWCMTGRYSNGPWRTVRRAITSTVAAEHPGITPPATEES